ncbi:MAG: hypothetical protein LUF90_10225 [Rikenellaceae bacterium]|nr:hypothetical protein [Rikenellaceae bacterium]
MKRIILAVIFLIISLGTFAQTYQIIGKGYMGHPICSGYVQVLNYTNRINAGKIRVNINNLGYITYEFSNKKMIDDKTIRYQCTKNTVFTIKKSENSPNNYTIQITEYQNDSIKSDEIYLSTVGN